MYKQNKNKSETENDDFAIFNAILYVIQNVVFQKSTSKK
jgi:hypothetical protein